MSGPKIQKLSRTVVFTLTDGSQIQGDVFLRLFSHSHDSVQRLGELLNDEDNYFIPVKGSVEASATLLNLDHVVSVQTERQVETEDWLVLGNSCLVRIKTFIQNPLEGEIFINLPNDSCRAKDFFNQKLKFFPLFQENHVVYVNCRHILAVND
jgi:hypothetical protein